MAKTNPQIVALCDKAKNEENAAIVALYNQIKVLGAQDRLHYQRQLHPTQVGVHRKNRDEQLVSGREALRRIDEVTTIGVDPDLYRDATAFEEPDSRENEIKFLELCALDEHLGNFEKGQIEVSSVACSHCTPATHCGDAAG